jgi:hypothetical protein
MRPNITAATAAAVAAVAAVAEQCLLSPRTGQQLPLLLALPFLPRQHLAGPL